jgi:uncharacterized C2H2 Zn-finger protein
MLIVLNEKEYAEECLKNKTVNGKPFYTLSILAKYYYSCFGYKKKKISELLTEFIKITYPKYIYSKATWDENIEKIAKNAGKYELHEIDGVWITKAELETIEKINNKVLEKLAFTLLCLAKLANARNHKNANWVNNDTQEVFNLARVSCNRSDRYAKLCQMHQLSLLEFPKRLDNLSCRVTYIDEDSEKKLFVSDFRELGYEYLKYKGENFTRCKECNILFRNNKNKTKKYCNSCSGYIPQETKNIICVDCGKEFGINAKNNQTCRCPECQTERNAELNRISSRERMKKYRTTEIE